MSRYNRVKRFSKNRVSRIGTADIPKVEDKNSDILLIKNYLEVIKLF